MALHHVAAGEVIGLGPLSGHRANARTHALAKTDRFEAILLAVPAEGSIAEHAVAAPITLHCLEGKVQLIRDGESAMLEAGGWVHLGPGEPHALKGVEDASLLLTIIF